MSEQTVRTDTLRHRVGECPACHGYLWAEVTVESHMSQPRLTVEGKASVYASARPVGMTVAHECDRTEEDA